jgi:predicted DNA-binding transcriptional regulator YafY
VDAAERALELLALLGSRPFWTGDELCDRLAVTDRTVRRDVARLRRQGYPIEATSGPAGGYRLGPGGRLPPLVLDDEEAVAVAVALRQASAAAGSGLEDASLTALTKLDQVLPPRLRQRVAAVAAVTLHLRPGHLPAVDTDRLVTLALCCRLPERVRFDYVDAQGRDSVRHVEPFRLVSTDRSWYLVARDVDRDAWRTFRVDRVDRVRPTGARFEHRDPPDAVGQVAAGLAVHAYDTRAEVVLHAPLDVARRLVPPTVGLLDPLDDGRTRARIGGDADWIARFLAGLDVRFEVLDPPALRTELRALARRLLRQHPAVSVPGTGASASP